MAPGPSRRRWLALGCAHCALLAGLGRAEASPAIEWTPPARLPRPDVSTDEGGLWALMDREETRLRRSSFVLRDAALREYLTGIACRLAGEHCADTRVYAVRTPLFNASMAPNGMMQVWTGLLLRAENEAQLAAVIGHEIGHYLQRHSLARLRDARSRSAFVTLMAPFGVVGAVGQLAALAGGLAYSREHEREADRIGLALMQRNGYDLREAARIWANLRAEMAAGPGGDPAQRSVMMATHPGIEERQATLQQLAGDGGGEVFEAAYHARIEPILWTMLEDELKQAQYDETIQLFGRLCARRPGRGDLRWFLGEARRLRGKDGDAAAALDDCRAALALQPAPAEAWRSLGFLHRALGQPVESAAAFTRYVELLPDAPDAAIVRSYLTEMKP
jgi:predicted Zn-dependent protease